ncbi:lysis system i-spanin subunit Rz [Acinetobacter ursingii]|uniref:lysis system i-spanin subunit Rz n=1 Tax=Acinetobacter TaxID=469 RepID=UPI00125EC74E|nr:MULTISPECIES: lysis system i-spanin subunit Rz [Acinetobacter]MDH0008379.1 lysis system i-spanin subunit Rz [Acinetobacter ursingii]MDH0480169.1 lysis system i-spanin subunit Rz [Acinetobacter ursingii]MDH2120777.1 lysis system i-spanin subunit Rz [Acinetobacter ursingii]MDH2128347.1 lysis system i-spanin subunit Rz [Acinetobacter ursingii]
MNLNLIGAITAILVTLFLVWCGYDYGYNKAKSEQIQSYLIQFKQLEEKLKTAVDNERKAYATQEQIESKYLDKIEEIKHNETHLIDQYRAGSFRLRDSLKPKQCPDVSTVASTTSNSHADTTGGLLDTDVELLVRLAAKADAVTEQLATAQQIIIEDRELCNGSK